MSRFEAATDALASPSAGPSDRGALGDGGLWSPVSHSGRSCLIVGHIRRMFVNREYVLHAGNVYPEGPPCDAADARVTPPVSARQSLASGAHPPWHTGNGPSIRDRYASDEEALCLGLFHQAQMHYIGRARMTYSDAILAALARSGRAGREVSIAAVGHESAIRSIKRGMDVRTSTLRALCEELGLEFYVGPPRLKPAEGGSHAVPFESASLRRRGWRSSWMTFAPNSATLLPGTGMPSALRSPGTGRRASPPIWRGRRNPGRVPAYAGSTATRFGSADGARRVARRLYAGRLPGRPPDCGSTGIDSTPRQCAIVRMRGESMEPTLSDGSTILVNRAQRRRRSGRLFAVRTDEGLVVRRLRKDPGRQLAACQRPR